MTVTIFHNPNCGTSRNVLQMIRDTGQEPQVVEYLKTGWTADGLKALLAEAGLTPRQALRTKGDTAAALIDELKLREAGVSDEAVFAAMLAHPVLVERPFVRARKGTVLARPKEKVLEVL